MGAELTLHPVGLSEEEQKILSVAMNVLLACGCGVRFAEQMTGDSVAVVDIDSDEGRSFYENAHGAFGQRTLLISGDDSCQRIAGVLKTIKKPLRVQTLRNVLSELSEQEKTQLQPDVGAAASAITEPSSGDELPNESLFYAMVNAVSLGQYLLVTAAGRGGQVLIHGPTRHVYSNMPREELEALVSLKGLSLCVAALDEFAFMKMAQSKASYRIEKLLWLAEEKGALGYPPLHYDSQLAFRLNDWPRFDVKHVKPEYLTLSAITTRQTLSPESLMRMTGISLDKIFDFYHAAKICGVVEHAVAEAVPESVQAAPVRTIVSHIAKKLGLSFF